VDLTARERELLAGSADAFAALDADIVALKAEVAALKAEVGELRTRVTAQEQRKVMTPKGVWHPDAEYEEGDACTDRGSLWLSVRRSRGCRPGSDANYWTMVVKNGAAR
jgi:hypothetical protein